MFGINFTKRQWLTLVVFGIADFCNAICVSLQAPFYPQEAERKGATATEYGLVFGIFELVVFIISPFYGQHLNKIGPKFLFNSGIFTVGFCAILFGLLDKVEGHYPFITFSFIIRIIEAMGNAAFLTASFAIIAKEFPDNVAITFASLETFFGLGLIVGPTVGGALYEIGGYTTPFAVMGSLLFLSAIMTAFVLPEHAELEPNNKEASSLLQVLKIPGVMLAACSIIVTSTSIGFLQATLEPHLRQFNLSPMVLGLMFVINGGTYAVTAPAWGWLCDKHIYPKYATVIGCLLIIIGFSLVGPAPFIPGPTLLWLTIIGLVLHGFGIAAQLVASFTDALRTVVDDYGFENDLETYGLISGLWTSTFALGAFIGPSLSGILYDSIGFRNGTMLVVGLNSIVLVLVIIFICCAQRKPVLVKNEEEAKLQLTTSVSELNSRNLSGGPGGGQHSNGGLSLSSSRSRAAGISIERPPGMNGLIAVSSYKNRLGTLHMLEANKSLGGSYSGGYGSLEHGGFLESTT